MIKCYLILAHKNPKQLKRLIKTLFDESSHFFIHIDLKSPIEDFAEIGTIKNVHFIKNRVDCIWADFSQVSATITLLKEALTIHGADDSKFILLSGQDYPIKNKESINKYFSENNDTDFLTFSLDPIIEEHPEFINNYQNYKINLSSKRNDIILTKGFLNESLLGKLKILNLLLTGRISLKIYKETFYGRKVYFQDNFKGPQWFVLRRSTVQKLVSFIEKDFDNLFNYYKYTSCADEHFFHTIYKQIAKNDTALKAKPYLHYIDWSAKDIELPVILKKEHYNILKNQPPEKLFARKFDDTVDSEILDLIDKYMFGR